jgi:hypothetical protein
VAGDREARRELMFEDNRFIGRPMQQSAYAFVAGRGRMLRRTTEGLSEIARQRHRNPASTRATSLVRDHPLTNTFGLHARQYALRWKLARRGRRGIARGQRRSIWV